MMKPHKRQTMKRHTLLITILMLATALLSEAGTAGNDGYLFRMLDTGSGLPDNNVRNMTRLPEGLMCIQTSSMLNIYDGASCRSYKYNAIEIPYTEYSGLNESCYDPQWNVLWCMTRDHIWLFDLKSRTFEYDLTDRLSQTGMEDGEIRTVNISEDGMLWLCSTNGKLMIWDRTEGTVETASLPEEMEMPVIMREYKGRMWFLSMNGILAEYAPPSRISRP